MVCLQQSAVGKRLQNVGSRSNVQGCACMVCKTCTCMATPHRPAHPQPAAGPWIRCRMPTTASTLAFHIHPPTPRFRLADPGLWPCCRFTVPRHLLHDCSFSSNPSLPPSFPPASITQQFPYPVPPSVTHGLIPGSAMHMQLRPDNAASIPCPAPACLQLQQHSSLALLPLSYTSPRTATPTSTHPRSHPDECMHTPSQKIPDHLHPLPQLQVGPAPTCSRLLQQCLHSGSCIDAD